MRAVALLRGIGPLNPAMKNENLRGVLTGLGLTGVATVISSGNVVFDLPPPVDPNDLTDLQQRIELAWPRELGFTSITLLRSAAQIADLIDADPFAGWTDEPTSRFQVTFLQRPSADGAQVSAPSGDAYEVVRVLPGAICWVEDSTAVRTPSLIGVLEREHSTRVSTRTWRTVHRIAARLG